MGVVTIIPHTLYTHVLFDQIHLLEVGNQLYLDYPARQTLSNSHDILKYTEINAWESLYFATQ
jgi:hypothetical protein